MQSVISVENLSKKYIIGHQKQESHATLRDVLTNGAKHLTQKLRHPFADPASDPTHEEFWALKDVSFDIQQGDRVGIIGRNGAGKSTLLKILSRITEPTSGRVSIKGRVASLLEVGTGFHPELSGRENIFLNGAILGMSKVEIKKKFDAIVAFAEVERFLDTPVKRYSSGMYVRLAFAVAAHLEPEILIVDEVLAVGDAQFQKKCLGKMEEAGQDGRTILFISHNMQAVKKLCTRGIVLGGGRLVYQGSVENTITNYLDDSGQDREQSDIEHQIRALASDPVFRFNTIGLTQCGKELHYVETGQPITVDIDFSVLQPVSGLRLFTDLCDSEGNVLARSFHDDDADDVAFFSPGRYQVKAFIPTNVLGPTSYTVVVRAGIHNVRSLCPSGIQIRLPLVHSDRHNRAYLNDTFRAKLILPIEWSLTRKGNAE
jgi:lipopolysaccharide transport system ATP-binding protein